MLRKWYSLLLSLIIACGCSGGGDKIVKVTKFSPPASVEVKPLSRALEVTWKPSPDEGMKNFEGYHVYCTNKSLLLIATDDLPQPAAVAKEIHSVTIGGLEPGRPYFVHVRSRKKDGELSVPSLPEVVGIPAS